MNLQLVSVYDVSRQEALSVLYLILAERTPEESISHQRMPSREEHERYVLSRPYMSWFLIEVDGGWVGTCYLSYNYELGVGILSQFRRRGYAEAALRLLISRRGPAPMPYLANVNPANTKSVAMFKKLGFNLIQHTFALEVE